MTDSETIREGVALENRAHVERRERIATAVLAGMAARPLYPDEDRAYSDVARDALMYADALIAALDAGRAER